MSVNVDPVSAPDVGGDDPDGGSALLMEVRSFIKRFCSFPDGNALTAVTLWAAHAHMVRHFHTTPRLALISPEPGSGKTRVLEILDLLVSKSMFCLSASSPGLAGVEERVAGRTSGRHCRVSRLAVRVEARSAFCLGSCAKKWCLVFCIAKICCPDQGESSRGYRREPTLKSCFRLATS